VANKVSLSHKELSLEQIAINHADLEEGLFRIFSEETPALLTRHIGKTLTQELENALTELEHLSSLSILSTLEAIIRIDYIDRVKNRYRDPLSTAMREIYKRMENSVRLEDDLLRLWKENTSAPKTLIGDISSAYKYRHWLAHGRYWTPKLGRRYDYITIYEICKNFISVMEST